MAGKTLRLKAVGINSKKTIILYAALYQPTTVSPFIKDNITVSVEKNSVVQTIVIPNGNASFIVGFQKLQSNSITLAAEADAGLENFSFITAKL
jgi:hypothetical protein